MHYKLLTNLPESSLTLLLTVFNSIWESGIFPPSWRKATIVAIPKPGKDSSDPNNYRPIALTSCLCKTMERMVNNRLMWILESKGLLASEQCGFRKNRSTADHLVRFDSYIRNAFAKKEHVLAIFFDLEKAYDTTWKHGILSDLYDLDFRGHLPTFIDGFLSHRLFQVRAGSTL
ncbi:RNA-directed DNA polymerase, partial [Thiolapillus sp.]|uniref:RNA-directed DNA polymerase n=1 Tax=Thiolapillus sp. TaxID=2017437 RepID=UPI003AF5805D